MTKPTNPNLTIPEYFAINGIKTDFETEKIQNGFNPLEPDILSGDNLNKFIDDTYKGLHFTTKGVADLYKSVIHYDETETYNKKSIVFHIDDDGKTTIYKSLTDNNTGNNLSDTTKWEEISLGTDNLNNPYSLFDSKYSGHELNNLSWLKSEGQWNAKAVYTDAYDKLLRVYNGTETVEGLSVKLSTENYTDYDFVLNSEEQTFRLPILTHERILVDKKVPTDSDLTWYNLYSDGWCEQGGFGDKGTITLPKAFIDTNYSVQATAYSDNNTGYITSYKISSSQIKLLFTYNYPVGCYWVARGYANIPTESDNLYFYVGETVQNANLIDAGRIGESLAGKLDISNIARYPIEISDKSLMPSWYVVYSDGWCEQGGTFKSSSSIDTYTVSLLKHYKDTNYNVFYASENNTNSNNQLYKYFTTRNKTVTGFQTSIYSDCGNKVWKANGYIN